MMHYKITCPECGAVLVTASREAVVLERCPSCRRHTWDSFDIMLAEVAIPVICASGSSGARLSN